MILLAEVVTGQRVMWCRLFGLASVLPKRLGGSAGLVAGGANGFDPMECFYAGAVSDLMAATESTSYNGCPLVATADGWEQAIFADLYGQVIMLFLIAERAGHSAAAGIDLGYRNFRYAVEYLLHGGCAEKCFLMAVAVDEDFFVW